MLLPRNDLHTEGRCVGDAPGETLGCECTELDLTFRENKISYIGLASFLPVVNPFQFGSLLV